MSKEEEIARFFQQFIYKSINKINNRSKSDVCGVGHLLGIVHVPGGHRLPSSGRRCDVRVRAVRRQLLADLEYGQTGGDDEGEESQLETVPRLQAQHADGERYEDDGLEQDEDQDGDEDLLQLGLLASYRKWSGVDWVLQKVDRNTENMFGCKKFDKKSIGRCQ